MDRKKANLKAVCTIDSWGEEGREGKAEVAERIIEERRKEKGEQRQEARPKEKSKARRSNAAKHRKQNEQGWTIGRDPTWEVGPETADPPSILH